MVWDMQYILSQIQERKCLRDSWSSLQQIRDAMKICFYIIILKKSGITYAIPLFFKYFFIS